MDIRNAGRRGGAAERTMAAAPFSWPPPMTQSTAPLPDADLALLRILCSVAWADGDFAPEERTLLERLVERYFLPGADDAVTGEVIGTVAAEPGGPESLEAMVPRLTMEEDRELALKLAYMVIRIGRRPGDDASINLPEKRAYRRLLELLRLPDEQVREIEWAAEQELNRHRSLWDVLRSRFPWLAGRWPDDDLLETPGAPRL
jgi:uncharacterized tellurite resistance protein B-like protein